ncbi:helix-turn-helix domain-containing protein [Desulfomicrobium orale]|uniref:DNA-binding protein n=1 Tax=Desulfomicrobium orale DSM 12838 TaxID=888061 RepID=A0A120KNB6_9BACT|nr:cupin domain-containing protein [Desulfomicrobium orale]AMD93636.1 DNA-binding protein [Desulfomicrobium orale DSM 12838]MDO4768388.1 cupin domain-containing protein [Pseudomonadota bacterium]
MSKEKLGMRVKRFREMNEITLEQLAERTGLSLSFLKSLEEDSVYPSLGPLLKVARGLGVRMGTFLDDELGQDPLVVRLGGRVEDMAMQAQKGSSTDTRYYSLGRGKTDRRMEPFFVELLPVAEAGRKLSTHEGEEFIVVQEGAVEVIYGGETIILSKGDSIYLNSVVPHHVGCSGDAPASIYAVLYFPE